MEQRNNLVLHGTETFSRGALDNVALESGAVVLDSSAGRYLPYGSYTTPEFAMPAFCNLNVSWNASAPHNTMVEVRCRVYAGNTWTGSALASGHRIIPAAASKPRATTGWCS
jgi:hypothetical protein